MFRILVIEDNLEIRENTAEILELAGYEVLLAANGNEGAVLTAIHHPDLVLCDILMPGMNGYELLEHLRQQEDLRHLPFIFLTALAEASEMLRGMELGADDYITKPFTDEELLEAVRAGLDKMTKEGKSL